MTKKRKTKKRNWIWSGFRLLGMLLIGFLAVIGGGRGDEDDNYDD